jgi:hypothetical protein
MERALRLEVAKQKSLHGVWDMVIEKAMRRFGMISTWRYKRIVVIPGEGVGVEAWKEGSVSAYNSAVKCLF